MVTLHSVRAGEKWTATASGSPATGPATSRDANTTSGTHTHILIYMAVG